MVSHNPTGESISDDGSARTKTDGGNNDSKINTTRQIPLFGLIFMFLTRLPLSGLMSIFNFVQGDRSERLDRRKTLKERVFLGAAANGRIASVPRVSDREVGMLGAQAG